MPKCLSSAALYGESNALQIPFKSIVEEYKVAKVRTSIQFMFSKDPRVTRAGVEVYTGKKWKAAKEVKIAEERLREKEILGAVATGRAGLGFFPTVRIDKALGRERHKLLQSEIHRSEEEKRVEKIVGMRQQGAWTKWKSMVKRKITWSDLWRNEFTIRFLIRSVYDILPSPTNLLIWKKMETPLCQLCGKTGSLKHILSSCQTALADGRYRWRHDQILKDIAEAVAAAIHTNIPSNDRSTIEFVKAGVKAKPKKKLTPYALSSAADWEVRADLGKRLKFPVHIVQTALRPDIVIFSNRTRKIIMWELTVPWEENAEEPHERKKLKYYELVELCKNNGWKAKCTLIEVGSRGFVARSLCKALSDIGLTGSKKEESDQ